MLDPKVTFIETVEDTEKYRIDRVDVFMFEHSVMLSLTIKVMGIEIKVRRWNNWDHYLKQIKKKMSTWEEEDGFYFEHGRGHPLDEFEDDNFEWFTKLTPKTGYHKFWGNHHRTGPAFSYIIWSKELVQEIEERLEKANIHPKWDEKKTPIA